MGASLLLITPLRGLAALRDEIDAKSIDLLVLTRLKSWHIVLGKWTSLMAQASLLLISVLPYAVVRYFFGAVNLMEDFGLIAIMFGASGVLTGVALWFSSLPKAFRILLPVLLVVGFQGTFMSVIAFRSMGRGGVRPTSYGLSGGPNEFLAVIDSALLLIFFLHQSVRRLAPPAENHAFATRLLALTVIAPMPMLHFLRDVSDEKWQTAVAFVVLMIVAALESAVFPLLMRVHWTRWLQGSGVRAAIGRLFLPGWPSAAMFTAVALALYFLISALLGGHGDLSLIQNARIAVHAWEAIVFPAILISFLPAHSLLRAKGAAYFGIQALVGIMISISANRAVVFLLGPIAAVLDFVCHFLPISSFWLSVTEDAKTAPSFAQTGMQITVFIAVVVLFIYASRSYWARLKSWRVAIEPNAVATTSQPA